MIMGDASQLLQPSITKLDHLASKISYITPRFNKTDNPYEKVEELSEREAELERSKQNVEILINKSQQREGKLSDLSLWKKDERTTLSVKDRIKRARYLDDDSSVEVIDLFKLNQGMSPKGKPDSKKQLRREKNWIQEQIDSEKTMTEMLERMKYSLNHLKSIKQSFSKAMEHAKSVEELQKYNRQLTETIKKLQVNIANALLENKHNKDKMALWRRYILDKDELLVKNLKREEGQVRKLRAYIRELKKMYENQDRKIDTLFDTSLRSDMSTHRMVDEYKRSKEEFYRTLPEKLKSVTEQEVQKNYMDVHRLHEIVLQAQLYILDDNGAPKVITAEDLERDPSLLNMEELNELSNSDELLAEGEEPDIDIDNEDVQSDTSKYYEEVFEAQQQSESSTVDTDDTLQTDGQQNDQNGILNDESSMEMIMNEVNKVKRSLNSLMDRCQLDIFDEELMEQPCDEEQLRRNNMLLKIRNKTFSSLEEVRKQINSVLCRDNGNIHFHGLIDMKEQVRLLREGLEAIRQTVTGFQHQVLEGSESASKEFSQVLLSVIVAFENETNYKVAKTKERVQIETAENFEEKLRSRMDQLLSIESSSRERMDELTTESRRLEEDKRSLQVENRTLAKRIDELTQKLIAIEEEKIEKNRDSSNLTLVQVEIEKYKEIIRSLQERSQDPNINSLGTVACKDTSLKNGITDVQEPIDPKGHITIETNIAPSIGNSNIAPGYETQSRTESRNKKGTDNCTPERKDRLDIEELERIVEQLKEENKGLKAATSSNSQKSDRKENHSFGKKLIEKQQTTVKKTKESKHSTGKEKDERKSGQDSTTSIKPQEQKDSLKDGSRYETQDTTSNTSLEKDKLVIHRHETLDKWNSYEEENYEENKPNAILNTPQEKKGRGKNHIIARSPPKYTHPIRESRFMRGKQEVESLRHKRWLDMRNEILAEQERKSMAVSHLDHSAISQDINSLLKRPLSDRGKSEFSESSHISVGSTVTAKKNHIPASDLIFKSLRAGDKMQSKDSKVRPRFNILYPHHDERDILDTNLVLDLSNSLIRKPLMHDQRRSNFEIYQGIHPPAERPRDYGLPMYNSPPRRYSSSVARPHPKLQGFFDFGVVPRRLIAPNVHQRVVDH